MRTYIYSFGNRIFTRYLATLEPRAARMFESRMTGRNQIVYTSRNDLSKFVPSDDAVAAVEAASNQVEQALVQAEHFQLQTHVNFLEATLGDIQDELRSQTIAVRDLLLNGAEDSAEEMEDRQVYRVELHESDAATRAELERVRARQGNLAIDQANPDILLDWYYDHTGEALTLDDFAHMENEGWQEYVYRPMMQQLDRLVSEHPSEIFALRLRSIAWQAIDNLLQMNVMMSSEEMLYQAFWDLMITLQEGPLMHAALERWVTEPDAIIYLFVPTQPLYDWLLQDGIFPEEMLRTPEQVLLYREPFRPSNEFEMESQLMYRVTPETLEEIEKRMVERFVQKKLTKALAPFNLKADKLNLIQHLGERWSKAVHLEPI